MRLAIATLLCLALVAACAGTDPAGDPAQFPALSRVDPEPAGANCPIGGSTIRTGLDRDGDGVLADVEVTSVQYLCDEPAATLLLRQDVEPPGANCAEGGTALRAGLDANGDGLLEDAEILKTNYACGEAPAAAPATLTRMIQELPGTACPAGGTRVDAGPDLDANGVLDDLEVRDTTLVCGAGPVLTRSRTAWLHECGGFGPIVESGLDANLDGVLEDTEVAATLRLCGETVWLKYPVSTAEDVAFLQGVKRIRGSLVVQGTLLESIVLWLEVIDGNVEVLQNPGLKRFQLTVGLLGGGIRVSANPLLDHAWIEPIVGRDIGGLRVPGDVVVEGNPKLRTALGSGDLGWVDGSLVLRDNDVLQMYDSFEYLRFVGGDVVVKQNGALDGLSLPALEWVLGDFIIQGNPSLHDTRSLEGLLVNHLGGRLFVSDNPALRNAQFNSMITVGGIELSNNPELPYLWLPNVHTVNGGVSISGQTGLPWFSSAAPLVIDGSLVVANTPLVEFELLSLAWIGGDLRVLQNANLVSFRAPALERVAGDVSILDNAVLSSVDGVTLGALERAGSLSVERNPLLEGMALPSLASVYWWVHVTDNPKLPTCQAEALVAQLAWPPSVLISGNDDAATCP